MLAEVAAWSAGPVLVTVGVLNNLETLTWLPWMALAARLEDRRSLPLLAAATSLGWLGGEPQVWAMGVVLVIAVARRRGRAVIGIGLGVAVVAVQLVPFLVWVAEGDRGPSAAWLLRGAVAPADWSGVLVPGLPTGPGRMIYAESLFLGAPVLVCALLGGWRRRWLLVVAATLALLATLPEIGAGRVFMILTGGLVRYPSRFALIGLTVLLPLAGKGVDDWLAGRGRWLAVAASCEQPFWLWARLRWLSLVCRCSAYAQLPRSVWLGRPGRRRPGVDGSTSRPPPRTSCRGSLRVSRRDGCGPWVTSTSRRV
jgi:hypothetical protein